MNVTINIQPVMSTQVGFPDLTDPSNPDPKPEKPIPWRLGQVLSGQGRGCSEMTQG